jgi:hypothetical protein
MAEEPDPYGCGVARTNGKATVARALAAPVLAASGREADLAGNPELGPPFSALGGDLD